MLVVKSLPSWPFLHEQMWYKFLPSALPSHCSLSFSFLRKNNHIPSPYPGEKVAQGSKQTFLPHGKGTERESFLKGEGLSKMKNILFSLLSARHAGSQLNYLLCGSAAGLAWHLELWLLCLPHVNTSPHAQWPHLGSQPSLTLILCTWFPSTATSCFTESPREELQMHLRYPSYINGTFPLEIITTIPVSRAGLKFILTV